MKKTIPFFTLAFAMNLLFTNANAQLANIPVTGFNNDIVAGGVGSNSILGTTNPTIGTDGAHYTFIDNTYKYVSTNALPTCFMPVNNLAPSAQTPGLIYQFQPYGVGATLSNNALTIVNQSTAYTSPYPSSASLSLVTPASYSKLYVLYESVSNIPLTGFTFDAFITFTDATTQSFPNNTCVNWFTATLPAFNNVGRTSPTGNIECGLQPNFFEFQMPLLAANYTKLVQSVTFSIPTIMTTGAFPYSVNYFHAMALGGLTPCAAPTAQVTAPSLSALSTSQINGTYTAAIGSPSGYLVVRYPTGATEVLPVNGTTYTAGQSLGIGTIIQSSTATAFSATGLSGSTAYDFYVYSYNGNTTCGGPMYFTTGGFIGTQSTNSCGTISGVIPVGASAPAAPAGFSNITSAVSYINANGLGGATVLELQTDYVVSGETFPITFALNPCVSATNPLTIRPAAGVSAPFVLSSSSTSATIVFDGATNITIDGRNGGTGTNKYISIVNTSTATAAAGNAVLLKNDAQNIVLTYLDVQSANANAAVNTAVNTVGSIPGAIAIGTTTGLLGNDNNTISFCNVHSTGTNLGVGIYAGNTTTAGSPANNDNNSITDNNIYDFYLPTTSSAALNISGGNNTYIITNNKVFQTIARTYSGTQVVRGLWITPNITTLSSASGFSITGNYIGGNSSTGVGVYSMSGTSAWLFYGMDISVGLGTATSVQNNTITNINMTTTNANTAAFVGINIANGNVNLGTVTGNLIGSTTSTTGSHAITFSTRTNLGGVGGIRNVSTGTVNLQNNVIAGIDIAGDATAVATSFNGISSSGGTVTIANNTIGSSAIPNSINMVSVSATSAAATAFRGIIINGSVSSSVISGNLIANLNTNYSATGAQANTLVGIAVTIGTSTISANTIRNLSSATQTTATGSNAGIVGISYTSTTASANITGNIIHSLILTGASFTAAVYNTGIFVACATTGTNVVSKNNIHNLNLTAANNVSVISGIVASSGAVTYSNNMISLGYNEAGNSITAGAQFRGITKASATASRFYYNSVYIGGTGVTSSALNTFAFQRTAAPTALPNDEVVNNIFVNNRSNATTGGKHYAVNLNSTTFITINYNDYTGSGTGYVFGNTGAADVAAYASAWVTSDVNSITSNPQFVNPAGTSSTVDLHINAALSPNIDQAGTTTGLTNAPTDDFDGDVRANFTPVDLGADAFNVLGAFSSSPLCAGSNLNLTAFPAAADSYSWTGPNAFASASQNPTITGVTSLAAGTYTCVITVSAVPSTYTVAVTVNSLPTVAINASLSTICSGTSANLGQTGLTNYTWSTGAISITPITVSPSGTQTYSITGTDANGCAGSASTVVNVMPSPFVSVSANITTICSGNAVSLVQSGLNTFTWSAGGATTDTLSVSPNSTTTYTVSGTSANGCAGSATKTITVLTSPVVTISSPVNSICSGTSVSLSQTGLTNFTWSPIGGTTSPLTVSPTSTTTYTLSGTSANGCAGSSAITISVVASPLVTVSATDTIICSGISTTLTQSGLITFSWTPGGSAANSITESPTSTQLYSVNGTDGNGCAGAASLSITVLPVSVSISSTDTTICNGDGVTLTQTGLSNFNWNGGLGTLSSVTDNPASTQTYSVIGTAANGCADSASLTINVNALPTVTANTSSDSICVGSAVTLNGGGAATYIWDNSVTDALAFNPTATNTYNVTGMDVNGCTNTSSVTVTVNLLPTVNLDLSAVDTLCDFNTVTLSGGSPASGIYTGTGVSGNIFDANISGAGIFVITYTYTDANTCSFSATGTIFVDVCSGLSSVTSDNSIGIYPNPFTFQTTISFNEKQNNTTLKMVDILGETVMNTTISGVKNFVIEKGNLKQGIYFVQITDEKGKASNRKIIIQ